MGFFPYKQTSRVCGLARKIVCADSRSVDFVFTAVEYDFFRSRLMPGFIFTTSPFRSPGKASEYADKDFANRLNYSV